MGVCLVCTRPIHYPTDTRAGEETTSLQFAGDATHERGRYSVHTWCMQPGWRQQFVTRLMLDTAPKG